MTYEQLAKQPDCFATNNYIYRKVKSLEYRLYKPNVDLLLYGIKTQRSKYTLLVFLKNSFMFAGAVGPIQDVEPLFVSGKLKELKATYSEYIDSLTLQDLIDMSKSLDSSLEAVLSNVETRYLNLVAKIRKHYETTGSDVQRIIRKKLLAKDLDSDVFYVLRFEGYADSKPYGTFHSALRAHSKRNIPTTPCSIIRNDEVETIFAEYNTDLREWKLK